MNINMGTQFHNFEEKIITWRTKSIYTHYPFTKTSYSQSRTQYQTLE